jgi:hypothetical protein
MIKKAIVWGLICLPVAVLWGYFFWYALDVPWFDDIEAFPGFLLEYLDAPSWQERWALLLKANNEHRIVFGKATLLLIYTLTGKLHFDWMMALGNLCVLGIFALLWRVFRQASLGPAILFLPVGLLLFQPHYHLLTYWAITGLQHQPTVMLVLVAIYLLSKPSPLRFAAAVGSLVIATFSMSNGMFGWVAGMAVLLLQGRFKALGLWSVAAGFAIFLYFSGFSTQGNEAGLTYFVQYPHKTFFAFFAFLGGIADWLPSRLEPYRYVFPIGGGFLLISFLVGVLMQYARQQKWSLRRLLTNPSLDSIDYFLVGAFTYLLVNAAVVALLRPRFGFSVVIVSNYKLYPSLFAGLVYLTWLRVGWARKYFPALVVLCLALNVLAYWRFTPEVVSRRRSLLTGSFNQQHSQVGLGGMVGTPLHTYIANVMNRCVARGLYEYPTWLDEPSLRKGIAQAKPLATSERVQVLPQTSSFTVWHPTFVPTTAKDDGLYVVLVSAQRLLVCPTLPVPYTGRNPFGKAPGYAAFVQKAMLDAGDYRVFVLKKSGKNQDLLLTNQRITL